MQAASLCCEVDFFPVQLSRINIIASAKQFNTYHVFVNSAVIHVPAAGNRISDTDVTEIKFFRPVVIFHISMQPMVFFNFFICQNHKIHKDDIDIFKMSFQILNICLHQF